MRGIKIGVLIGTLTFLAAGSSQAFDLGGKLESAAKEGVHAGAKKVVEQEINKNLAQKHCAFKPKSVDLTCDLNDILSTIKTQKSVAEKSGFASNVILNVDVGQGKDPKNSSLGSQRMDIVRTKLHQKISWWDWWDSSVTGDNLKISVDIK